MELIRFVINNPVKVAVGVFLLVLFGLLSLLRVPVQLTPDVDKPVVTVTTAWPGASPQEIESEIVDEQEDKLKSVEGLIKLSSISQEGMATITLEFPVGMNKDTALREVSDKLRQVPAYPEEVDEPTVTATDVEMDKTIAWMILHGGPGHSVAELKTFVEDKVKPQLERAEGISEVAVYGGRDREVQIIVDAAKLASRGLTLRDVEQAVRRQNENISGGTIPQGKRDFTYRTVGEYENVEQIMDTVIAYRSGGPVLVRDMATVVDGFQKAFAFVRSKGEFVIAMPARRETGANVIRTMDNLREKIELVNREILHPRGMGLELTQVYDETTYIHSAIDLVVKNIYTGGFLAVVVLLLFLRSASATGIVALSIPISVIGTFLVVVMVGRTLNVVMLAGMAFAVGMVVDNAIVVLENIYRHRTMGKSRVQAALDGASEVWGAVLASTLTTVAVFVPVIFMEEEAGQLFKDVTIAVATAVGLSLVISVLVIPPLASRFLGSEKSAARGDRPWFFANWIAGVVEAVNRRVWTRTAVIVGMTGASFVGSYLLMPGTDYLPAGNRNLVFGFLMSPPGYSIEEYKRMALMVEEGDPDDPHDGVRPAWEAKLGSPEAAALPAVTIRLGKEGERVVSLTPPPIENFFFVAFNGGAFMGSVSKEETNVRPLVDLMNQVGSRIPGVFTFFSQASLFQGGSWGNAVELEVRGDSLAEVVASAGALQGAIMTQGYGYPRPDPQNFALGRPEVRLAPDRAKAADVGLDVRDVGFIIRACVDGAFVGEYNDHGDKIDMVIKVAGLEGADTRQVGLVPIYTPSGHVIPISSVVDFEATSAPQQINHIEEMPAVTLSVSPKPGVPLQDTMDELEQEIIAPLRQSGAIPPTVFTALAGTADKLTQTRRALLGDYRGIVNHPRLFGMSVAASVALIVTACAAVVVGVRLAAGARPAILAAFGAAAVLSVGFLVVNPQVAGMVFQSRMVLALLVTYLLMAALFESYAYPFVIMLSVPPAAVGGFAALRIVHEISLTDVTSPIQQLDVLTMLGFVILIGTVVNNAILIVHQALNFMRDEQLSPNDAVAKSVRTRTRPIFMTSLTTVVGMLPLVVMAGPGSELYRGIGSVVSGGMLVSTLFTLLVVPAMFSLFIDARAWVRSHGSAPQKAGVEEAPAPAVA